MKTEKYLQRLNYEGLKSYYTLNKRLILIVFTVQLKSRLSTNYVNVQSNLHPSQILSSLFKLVPTNRYAISLSNIGSMIFFSRPKIPLAYTKLELDRRIASPYPSIRCHQPRLFYTERILLPQANQLKYL